MAATLVVLRQQDKGDSMGHLINKAGVNYWVDDTNSNYYGVLNLETPSGVAVVSRSVYQALFEDENLLGLSEEILLTLRKYNIFHPEAHEKHRKKKGMSCWVHVTNQCNLACDYCYIHKTTNRMMLGTSDVAVQSIKETVIKNSLSRLHVAFAGGEPTLNLEVVSNICDRLTAELEFKPSFSITTNATNLKDEALSVICKHNMRVYVSLDGLGEFNSARRYRNGKSSVGKVLTGLKTITNVIGNKRLMVGIVVSPENVDGIYGLTKYLLGKSTQFKYSFYRPNEKSINYNSELIFSSNKQQDWNEFQRKLTCELGRCLGLIEKSPSRINPEIIMDKFSVRGQGRTSACSMGENYFAIGWDGAISRCHMIQEETVGYVDPKIDVLNLLSEEKNPYGAIGINCNECEINTICRGGCRLIQNEESGTSSYHHTFCAIFPKYIETIVKCKLNHGTYSSYQSKKVEGQVLQIQTCQM